MGKELYILGVGLFTPVCLDLAVDCGYSVAGLYSFDSSLVGQMNHGIPVIGTYDDLFSRENLSGMSFMLSMGNGTVRAELFERIISLGGCVPTLIHPTAVVSRFAAVSENGAQIGPFAFVQADSFVGDDTFILSSVNVSHNTSIGRHCLISGRSSIGVGTHIADFVEFGMGAIATPHKVNLVGEHSIVGAGSVLIEDVLPYSVVAGNPAKIIKK